MFKRRSFMADFVSGFNPINVVSSFNSAYALSNHLIELYPEKIISLSGSPVTDAELYIFVGTPSEVIPDAYSISITEQDCYGLTQSQTQLNDSDWQALRDCERMFLMMDENNLLNMPDDIRQRMTDREAARLKVDEEIAASLPAGDEL